MSVKLCLYYLNRHPTINGIGIVGRVEQLCKAAKLYRLGCSGWEAALYMSRRAVIVACAVATIVSLYADSKAVVASDSRIVIVHNKPL